jgi:pimeloyl-ACP methyl ester carboxylesterase
MDRLNVEIAGQQIAYTDSADGRDSRGERAVIFVHGNSSSAETWLPVIRGDFGRQFRCLALDLPGHGQSEPAKSESDYSIPGYAAVLAGFARTLGAADAVIVGWSLGGHIAMESAPELPDAAGFVIFGTPPVGSAAQMAEGFLPNPAMNVGFSASVTKSEAESYADSFTAPGSGLATDGFVSDILTTDGAARTGLMTSIGEGRFGNEVEIVAELRKPLAIVQGADEQLVRLDYLRKLSAPTLWRGEVQVMPGVGHALHQEAPGQFAALLTDFIADLDG